MESKFKTLETGYINKHFDIFKDDATRNKIYRHLIDINDTISEEDLKNIKVTFAISDSNQPINDLRDKPVMA